VFFARSGGAMRFFAQWRLCLIAQVRGGVRGVLEKKGRIRCWRWGPAGRRRQRWFARVLTWVRADVVIPLSFLGKFREGAKPRFVLGKFRTDLDFRQIEADLGVAAPLSFLCSPKYKIFEQTNLHVGGINS
jgi:hypothetical protein